VERHWILSRHPNPIAAHRSVTGGLKFSLRGIPSPSQSEFLFRARPPTVYRCSLRPNMVFVIVVVRGGAASPAERGPRPAAQGGLVSRGRGPDGRFPSPVVSAAAVSTQQAAEDASESLTKDAVDDEVGGRVDDDQQIAEMRGVDQRIRAVLVLRLADRLQSINVFINSSKQQ